METEVTGMSVHFTPDRVVRDYLGALTYQNPALVTRFAKRYKISFEKARHYFEELKKFLVTCGMMAEPCSPSNELDEIWHHFILHTHNYQEYCERYIGRFLHHNPTDTPFVSSREKMLALAERTFGQIDRSIWPKIGITACDSSCSGDNYCKGD